MKLPKKPCFRLNVLKATLGVFFTILGPLLAYDLVLRSNDTLDPINDQPTLQIDSSSTRNTNILESTR